MIKRKNKDKEIKFVPYGLYYKGELLLMGDIPKLLAILHFNTIVYYINWEENCEYHLSNFKKFLKLDLELSEILEYIEEDGEQMEVENTINPLKFPIFCNTENKLIVRELKFNQKWKVKNYLLHNQYQYKILLYKATLDLMGGEREYFDFEEFYLTPQNLFNFQITLIKILILEYFNNEMPKAKYGMKLIFRGLISLFYNNNKYFKNLKMGKKLYIITLYSLLIIWERKEEIKRNLFILYFKPWRLWPWYRRIYQYYYILEEEIFSKQPPLIQKIISLLPFTLLLYGKYNLGISGIGIFLGYYFIYRMSKVFLKWLNLIFRSFYEFLTPYRWERIFNRIVFPIITLINLGGIMGSFYLLSLLLPLGINIQFLGIILYTIIRYIIVELFLYRGKPIIMDIREVKEDSPFWMKWRNKWVKNINDYLQF